MRILVIGSGGREHALVHKLAQSPLAEKIFVAPGNGGTGKLAENVNLAADDIPALVHFAEENGIDLVVPGPELPLTLGITDAMAKIGVPCFGPDAFAARLEGSKNFAKEIMYAAGVPTAQSRLFTDAAAAKKYATEAGVPLVVKADGLAAGKGVIVPETLEETLEAIDALFAANNAAVLLEEKLEGEEVSLLCFCDGSVAAPLPSAQDHKKAYDGDKGPNTGGMGAYSPAPCLPDDKLEEMTDLVVRPILAEMTKRGHPFKGVLYAGLMLTPKGPKVLEYNVRFGDPECEPLLLRMQSDLAQIARACVNGSLVSQTLSFSPRPALGVVLAAEGYPGAYKKNLPLVDPETDSDTVIFHAGTTSRDGKLQSSGGRVFCVTALGDTLAVARDKAYAAVRAASAPGLRCRSDIGFRGLSPKNNG